MGAVLSPFVANDRWSQIVIAARPQIAVVQQERKHPAHEPLLHIRDLHVAFDTGTHLVPVLHGVNLAIARGETVGIVGESGCGKSVTWMAVMRLLGSRARISGQILLGDDDLATLPAALMPGIRGKRIAMIFQDPSSSLNPVKTVGKQLVEAVSLHQGLRGAAARAEAIRLLERVHMPAAAERMRAWPHELSGGMSQRVMIAMALAGQPELLIADEPTTALDVTIQAQILDLLKEIQQDTGMGLVMISHDLGVIAEVCDRVMVMYAGRVVESARAEQLFTDASHPYTRGLIAAMPDLEGPIRKLQAIPGSVPAPTAMPVGCSFAPRCTRRSDRCDLAIPELREISHERLSACWSLRP